MLKTSSLDYHLPADLIATRPSDPRDASRLLVVSRSDAGRCEHRRFSQLVEYLRPDDLMVFNTSSVIPARLKARRRDTGGAVEGLYLSTRPDGAWVLMLHAGGRLREGLELELLAPSGGAAVLMLTLVERDQERWVAHASSSDPGAQLDAPAALQRAGATPLPPYILKSRRAAGFDPPDELDRRWYQTVYADPATPGSVAAPTAGLHFTPGLLQAVEKVGVTRADVRLHVGAGTFKPIQTEYVEEHPIHEEWIEVPAGAIRELAETRSREGRILAVGTTSVRAIESLPDPWDDRARRLGFNGATRLMISPGYEFRWTDALLTNFHLPRSTLLALVAALFPGGVERLREIYATAVAERYRFYSYGDAMLILP